jgi:Alpha-L-arabinofuranosidase C-terminal domain
VSEEILTRGFIRITCIDPEHWIGEYAAVVPNGVTLNFNHRNFVLFPSWVGSVGEAVFLLGTERNSDRVIGASYVSGFEIISVSLSLVIGYKCVKKVKKKRERLIPLSL